MRKNLKRLISWLIVIAMTLAAVCYMPAVDAYAAAPLAYDSFSYSNGTLHNANGGSGWSAAWVVQNNNTTLPGYEVRSSSPLSYSNLQTSGSYAVGGREYLTAGRGLDVSISGPFSAYLTSGLIGATGKTLYMSLMLRKDVSNDDNIHVALHRDNTVTYENPDLVSAGYFGSNSNSGGIRYWTLKLGSSYYRTSVPVTVGQTALLVVKMDFGSTNTVSLYVNPSSLGDSVPSTASATGTTTSSIAFKSLAFYAGNSTNQSSVDEIRFGQSYADVTPVTSTGTGDGTGLKGEYFDNMDITNLKVTRTDATVNFDWGNGSPDAAISADTYSVRWAGQVQPLYSQTYTFYTNTDDGVRLWVNNQLIIDKWIDQPTTEWSGTIALTAGQKYDIKMEYYENSGGAVAKLLWSSASQAKEIIPQSQLYPAGTTQPDNVVNKVRFFPRSGFADRMPGGRFEGSNTSQTNDFVTLYTINATPVDGQWTEITFDNTTPYRYIKYYSPNGGWGNIAELEFYNGNTRLTGAGFGTAGSFNNSGNDYTKALDGNTATFFDAATADGNYVGIDIGATNQAAAPVFSPAPGSYSTSQTVTISTSTSGATIRYTTDGSTPTPGIGAIYSGSVTISSTKTLKAISYKSGMFDSNVTSGTYTIGGIPTGGYTTYHLGNSLTDTINGWLDPIADSAGYNHTYYRSTIPGAPTDWIWDHPAQALGEPDYRIVFDTKGPIDHLSTQPFAGHNRSLENESDYSGRFYNLCRQKSPNVQHWIYAQWPDIYFGDPWSQATGAVSGLGLTPATTWEEAVSNHMAYHEALRQRMDDMYDGKSMLIVPGGPALVNLKTEIEAGRVPGITDFFGTQFSDDLHLSAKGQYLVSLVFYSCIYKESPEGRVTYANTGLTAEQAAIYQRIAWNTVRNYQWSGAYGM